MATTTRGYPYPTNADAPNAPAQFQALATALDADVAAQILALTPRVFIKPSFETRTSTTSTTADADFGAIALGVGSWKVEGYLSITGAAAGDFRYGLTFSGTTTDWGRFQFGPASASTDVTNGSMASLRTTLTAGAVLGTDGTNKTFVHFEAVYVVTVAGALALVWAQGTSSATPTTLESGSHIIVSPLR